MSGHNVLDQVPPMTRNLYRQLVSRSVRSIQLKRGMSDEALADEMGISEGTIANAGNQNNSLSGELLFNLLRFDPYALEGFLHHFDRRSVPIAAKCDTDALAPTAAALHKLAVAQSDGALTDRECLDMETEVEAAIEALSAVKMRCEAIRKRRMAA